MIFSLILSMTRFLFLMFFVKRIENNQKSITLEIDENKVHYNGYRSEAISVICSNFLFFGRNWFKQIFIPSFKYLG
jgi:hypothetical protein